MKLKIAILGTRGIPNNYGGFEQITEYLSAGLVEKGHDITVYNSHNHPYRENLWQGVRIVHCFDPEFIVNTAGQFVYDLNCIRHARKQKFDVLLFMGYTSSSIWGPLFPKNSTIISNMDGLEWKRNKYSKPVQKFLKYAEKLAVQYSHYHIADSEVIQKHLNSKYGISCHYIPYGAHSTYNGRVELLNHFKLKKDDYYMMMARMEPENNVEMVLNGFKSSSSDKRFIVVGNTQNSFGKYIVKKFSGDQRIEFLGGIFNKKLILPLQSCCHLYFHGHSVGGTNPSLLEAMACRAPIAAHNNDFNRKILGNDAYYFSNSTDVSKLVDGPCSKNTEHQVQNNFKKIQMEFNWKKIIDAYDRFICTCHAKRVNKYSADIIGCPADFLQKTINESA